MANFAHLLILEDRYINKSAIHRLILNPDNSFSAQFRTVTILFVSLGDVKPWTPEGLSTCQKAISQVHKVMSEYEGTPTVPRGFIRSYHKILKQSHQRQNRIYPAICCR